MFHIPPKTLAFWIQPTFLESQYTIDIEYQKLILGVRDDTSVQFVRKYLSRDVHITATGAATVIHPLTAVIPRSFMDQVRQHKNAYLDVSTTGPAEFTLTLRGCGTISVCVPAQLVESTSSPRGVAPQQIPTCAFHTTITRLLAVLHVVHIPCEHVTVRVSPICLEFTNTHEHGVSEISIVDSDVKVDPSSALSMTARVPSAPLRSILDSEAWRGRTRGRVIGSCLHDGVHVWIHECSEGGGYLAFRVGYSYTEVNCTIARLESNSNPV